MSIEAMKQALEIGQKILANVNLDNLDIVDELVDSNASLRQAIAEAEKQEHSIEIRTFGTTVTFVTREPMSEYKDGNKFYRHPQPKRECPQAERAAWVGLTDEEIAELHHEIKVRLMGTFKIEDIYRAIEAKLKEKNT